MHHIEWPVHHPDILAYIFRRHRQLHLQHHHEHCNPPPQSQTTSTHNIDIDCHVTTRAPPPPPPHPLRASHLHTSHTPHHYQHPLLLRLLRPQIHAHTDLLMPASHITRIPTTTTIATMAIRNRWVSVAILWIVPERIEGRPNARYEGAQQCEEAVRWV